jgi:FixJ family two-component response regulator
MTRTEAVQDKPLVVVVDDDPAVRNSLKFSLEVEGFSVRAYADGASALKEAPTLAPVCLVADQNMPGLSGIELAETLSDEHIFVATILMTTHPSPNVVERARRVGVAIVEKPLLGDVLLDAVKTAARRAVKAAKPN